MKFYNRLRSLATSIAGTLLIWGMILKIANFFLPNVLLW
jgi:hypothetical protein